MQISSLLRSAVLTSALMLLGLCGCSGTPDGASSLSLPTFGGVPDQWEPEITAMEEAEDEPAF